MKKEKTIAVKAPSDRAVQRALDEFNEMMSDDTGEWYAMLIALKAAAQEDAQYRSNFQSNKDKEIEASVIMFIVAALFFLVGMLIKWRVT